jgi:hypothetical protein
MVTASLIEEDTTNTAALSMTLQVGGAIVSGELISRARWRSEFKAWLATIGGSSDVISRSFDLADEVMDEEEDEDGPINFLHLRNVKLVTNYLGSMQGITPQGPEHPLWRTRVADVQGWTLGRPS